MSGEIREKKLKWLLGVVCVCDSEYKVEMHWCS